MNKKIFFQLSLIFLLFLTIFLFYKYFFETDQNSTKELANKENVEIVESDDNTQETEANIIENLKYFSEDLFGNKYTIEASSAAIKNKDTENLNLKDVNATIILKNKSIIYIQSKMADYNKINNNTVFRDNVKIVYGKQIIESDIINLNFEKNVIKISQNVYYMNMDTKMYADKIEIDLISNKLKISMNNKKDKILVKSKY
tara:strand:- start:1431 stop:2033 length:603 start_codon:yes stop_codon:yes gene_type:complete